MSIKCYSVVLIKTFVYNLWESHWVFIKYCSSGLIHVSILTHFGVHIMRYGIIISPVQHNLTAQEWMSVLHMVLNKMKNVICYIIAEFILCYNIIISAIRQSHGITTNVSASQDVSQNENVIYHTLAELYYPFSTHNVLMNCGKWH